MRARTSETFPHNKEASIAQLSNVICVAITVVKEKKKFGFVSRSVFMLCATKKREEETQRDRECATKSIQGLDRKKSKEIETKRK